MIIPLNTARINALEIKEILKRFSDKQHVDIILRDYIAYQGNGGFILESNIKQDIKNHIKNFTKDNKNGR